MNEKTTLEIIAPTVEEAIAQGLAELGLTADAVSVEVLDAGNKGLFGFGKHQVRIRLTVNPPGGEPEIRAAAAVSEPEPEAARWTQEKPAPVPAASLAKRAESQPEHDPV